MATTGNVFAATSSLTPSIFIDSKQAIFDTKAKEREETAHVDEDFEESSDAISFHEYRPRRFQFGCK